MKEMESSKGIADNYKTGLKTLKESKAGESATQAVQTVKNLARAVFHERVGYRVIGNLDVVRDYKWGVNTPSQAYISQVPVIKLKEYQPQNGPMAETILYSTGVLVGAVEMGATELGAIANNAKKYMKDNMKAAREINRDKAYKKMYSGTFTGNFYTLPYFSTYNHSISNNWGDAELLGAKLIGSKVDGKQSESGFGIKDFASLATNAYIAIPKRKEYNGLGDVSYEFSFQLYNTLGGTRKETDAIIYKNFSFLYTLQHNNMPDKLSFATLLPPVIYSVEIPGVRYSPAAYISTLVIENIGQVNRVPMTIDGETIEVNVPDAWNVQIVLTEMLAESRNIFNGVISKKNRVKVISSAINGTKGIDGGTASVKESFQ
jgi:hypothetical protein